MAISRPSLKRLTYSLTSLTGTPLTAVEAKNLANELVMEATKNTSVLTVATYASVVFQVFDVTQLTATSYSISSNATQYGTWNITQDTTQPLVIDETPIVIPQLINSLWFYTDQGQPYYSYGPINGGVTNAFVDFNESGKGE